LLLHLSGAVTMLRRRRADEAPVVIRAAVVALSLVLLQLGIASAMIIGHLPPVLRSLHEAVGVGIWLACFTFAYLARRSAARVAPVAPTAHRPPPIAAARARRPSPIAQ